MSRLNTLSNQTLNEIASQDNFKPREVRNVCGIKVTARVANEAWSILVRVRRFFDSVDVDA
jgi:hypothetical protein